MSSLRALPALLLAGTALVGACHTGVHEVELTFYDDGHGPHGFLCVDDGGVPLAHRAVTDGQLSLVVDLFRFDGSPACSAVALLEWCQAQPGGCPLLLDRRACLDVPLGFLDGGHETPITAVQTALAQLKGRLVMSSVPDEVVVVRVVATTATCAEVSAGGASFACSALVGCANSCAVSLADAGGEVELDLDIRAARCDEGTVGICASPDLTNVDGTCGGGA